MARGKTDSPNWGGVRPGAGRPAIAAGGRTVAVRLSAADLERLERIRAAEEHATLSEALRALIQRAVV